MLGLPAAIGTRIFIRSSMKNLFNDLQQTKKGKVLRSLLIASAALILTYLFDRIMLTLNVYEHIAR